MALVWVVVVVDSAVHTVGVGSAVRTAVLQCVVQSVAVFVSWVESAAGTDVKMRSEVGAQAERSAGAAELESE